MTEEEAKQRWCPFARGDSIARERILAAGDYTNRCIASACMAWRWHRNDVGGIDVRRIEGFCGLAGTGGAP